MNTEFRNRQLPNANPFANVLVVLVGAITIAVSFVIGVFALIALAVIVIVLATVIGVRFWWMRVNARKGARQHRSSGRSESSGTSEAGGKTVIEGEFRVIPVEKDRDKPPQT